MTTPDRSWMYTRLVGGYLNKDFVDGVEKFLEFAEVHSVHKNGHKLKCPCSHKKCRNANYLDSNEIKYHLYKNGFEEDYLIWKYHGESHVADKTVRHCFSPVHEPLIDVDEEPSLNLIDMVHHAAGPDFDENEPAFMEESPNDVAQSFYDLLEAGKKPLYSGCEKHTLLSFVSRLMNIKAENNISQKCYNQLSDLIREILPKDNLVPLNFYESKKLLRGIGLPMEKIDCCRNNCMIYWGQDLELDACKVCGEPRYKPVNQGIAKRRKSLVAFKLLFMCLCFDFANCTAYDCWYL
ncbi:hypothetical protein CASFOL_024122 [Castilleja foliolosa]|uniref:Transposase-associated domain-containing protein n=1 Tax=Castilleja foliolosa TaxID=1961234 RepID=A0ABD3CMF7_9LAMI